MAKQRIGLKNMLPRRGTPEDRWLRTERLKKTRPKGIKRRDFEKLEREATLAMSRARAELGL